MEEELLYIHERPMSVNKKVMPTFALLSVCPSYNAVYSDERHVATILSAED
jgi:hypothetical protein